MDLVRLFFLLLCGASLLFMILGLFKPYLLLWWEDIQNRRKVVKIYGGIALASYALYWVLYFFI